MVGTSKPVDIAVDNFVDIDVQPDESPRASRPLIGTILPDVTGTTEGETFSLLLMFHVEPGAAVHARRNH